MNKKILINLLTFLFLPLLLNAENAFLYSDPTSIAEIDKGIMCLQDKTNTLTIQDILNSKDFVQVNQKVPNLGVTSSSQWFKITIKNTTDVSKLLLKVDFPIIDEIEFYSFEEGNARIEKMGEYKNFSERKYNDPNYIYDITINKNETQTYYLKIKSGEQIMLPIVIGTPQEIFESISTKDAIFGIYFGIIIVMFLYNMFLYFTVKDKSYLFYIIYIMCVGLTQTFLHGYTFKYLWPNNSWLAIHTMYLLPSFVGIAIAEFAKVFLQVKEHSKILYKGFYIINFIYIICIILAITGNYNISQQLIHINAMLVSLYTLFVGFNIARKGSRPAIFFSIAWFTFLIGVCLFILKDLGVLPYNNFTVYAMPAGSAIEVILLSLALADRINILKKEKDESQAQALNALRQNESIIKNQNIVLERKVEERTKELKITNNELSTALSELKQTQSQLVNSEKMASLGQLTAGIAHEINHPINFVVSNIKPLKRDIEDIYELVKMYEGINQKEDIDTKIQNINKYRGEIDYTYIKEEIENLLKGIEDGAVRTADIVKGLRVFSRLDENDLKRTNITEGINSTLTLLNPEITGASIELVKNFKHIPEIECYPGKLNQVFMNIFNNAIFAIKENKERTDKGKLTITTTSDDVNVYLTIKDNGTGMTEEVKAKIFEPFFTTKAVGKGTGLGLSITFSIIRDHNGRIDINSEYGVGSEFIITIPINHIKQ
ncbi:MAG: sensor histidine kinase [Cytophaga sp.]|uniref:sensor histidine kinase n=1 Tax=Cytophaga sp. TaxID=29535 RepID=UPI003F8096F4